MRSAFRSSRTATASASSPTPSRVQQLWAPWRMAYVSTAGGPEAACVFCAALAVGDDRRALIPKRGPLPFLLLNAFPYASGHPIAAIPPPPPPPHPPPPAHPSK